jgi:hypothetical protein
VRQRIIAFSSAQVESDRMRRLAHFAYEAVIIDAARDLLDLWREKRGEVEIVVKLFRFRLHLEDHLLVPLPSR